MRYSLFTLLAIVMLVTAVLAAVLLHGLVGIILLLPHLLLIVSLTLLLRRRRWYSACVFAAVYIACWVLTAWSGIPAIRDDLSARIAGLRYIHPHDHGELQRISYDPLRDHSKPYPPHPWHFVGNESSPCPFVVTIEYGFESAPTSGAGGKIYVVWLFGYRWCFSEQPYWFS